MSEPPTLSLKMLNFKYKFGFSFNFNQKMQTLFCVTQEDAGIFAFNADAFMHL